MEHFEYMRYIYCKVIGCHMREANEEAIDDITEVYILHNIEQSVINGQRNRRINQGKGSGK